MNETGFPIIALGNDGEVILAKASRLFRNSGLLHDIAGCQIAASSGGNLLIKFPQMFVDSF